jgi:phosphate transport system permease protein
MSAGPIKRRALDEGVLTARASSAEAAFRVVSLVALLVPLAVLGVLLADAIHTGLPRLDRGFFVRFPSRHAREAGIFPALVGSLSLGALTALFAVPVGVGAAIWLEEYARPGRLKALVELNLENLAGVPSIVYGLLGLEVFVRTLTFGRSLLAGASTLALLVLPMIILASREALRAVPRSLREASVALGADRWAMLRHVVLPASLGGIATGVVLALGRALGSTAPLLTIGALTYVAALPESVWSPFTALPVQIFHWAMRPQREFQANASAAVVVLLALSLAASAGALALRARVERGREP